MIKYVVLVSSALLIFGCASGKKDAAPATPAAKGAKATSKAAPAKATAAPKAADSASGEGDSLECSSGADKRTLEVKKTSAAGCELNYTKFGNTAQVASSGSGHEHCESVRDKIKTKLEAAGYSCK
jgi:hypothetical protein